MTHRNVKLFQSQPLARISPKPKTSSSRFEFESGARVPDELDLVEQQRKTFWSGNEARGINFKKNPRFVLFLFLVCGVSAFLCAVILPARPANVWPLLCLETCGSPRPRFSGGKKY